MTRRWAKVVAVSSRHVHGQLTTEHFRVLARFFTPMNTLSSRRRLEQSSAEDVTSTRQVASKNVSTHALLKGYGHNETQSWH